MGASAMLFAGGLGAMIVLWHSHNGFAALPPPPVGMSLVATLVLVMATFCCWFAGQLLAAGRRGSGANGLYVAFLLTVAFVGIQLADRFGEYSATLALATNLFHALFWFLTLLHLLHVVIALLMLGRLAVQSWKGTLPTEEKGGIDWAINWMLYLLAVWLVLMLVMFII
jgi:heme/copper-type cytochrome/quinol oxidase subunit 3